MPQIDLLDLERQVLEEEAAALEAFHKGTGEPPIIYRSASGAVLKAEGDGPVEFVLSHESDDRMGDIIRQDGWQLENFKRNPVMLWAHDSRGVPPIGKWSNVRVNSKSLLGVAQFDADDPFAVSIEGKVRRGFLNAVSVGFRPLEMEWRPEKEGEDSPGGFLFRPAADFKKQELLETSVVSVPAHPKALRKALELAVDGAPQAKRFIFLPGENFGTFEAKAIEEPPAQASKDAHADEVDTVNGLSNWTVSTNGTSDQPFTITSGYIQITDPSNADVIKALNSLESAIRESLSKSASPVSVDEDTEPDSTPDPEPSLPTETEPDVSEDTLAIEASLAELRGALMVGD